MPSRTIPNQTAPYLTHMVSYHGQTTLVPPDNAGRIRKAADNSSKFRNYSEPVRRQQDSPTRGASSSRSHNQCVCSSDSARLSIPNYPPPSFQEAMASPPVSYAPSVSTMCHTNDDTDSVRRFSTAYSESELTEEELSRLSTTVMLGSAVLPTREIPPASPGSDSFSDSSSCSSQEFIQVDVLQREAGGGRRPESPGSPRDQPRALLEDDPEDEGPHTPDTAKPKSRTLSLSPLRTLLPSTKGAPSNASSTFLRASTSTSNLLSRAASSPFFRSTTTLASPSSDSPRKKIFAGKGKLKADDEQWEVLDAPSGTEAQPPNLRRAQSARSRRSATSPRRYSARNGMPPPPVPPIRIPPSDPTSRTESPPIVTVRTRRFPRTTIYVPSPLAHHADPYDAAVNVPLPSTPGIIEEDNSEPSSPLILSMSSPPTPRRHYPGRPLPRPPGIDGAAAHLLTRPLTPPVPRVPLPPITPPTRTITPNRTHAPSHSCPEGLLIDFRDSAVVETPTTPSAIDDLFDVFSDTSENPAESIPRSLSPFSQASSGYPEPTDLDLLASQLTDEGARTGADYETMLLISEFAGPASPIGSSRRRRNALSTASRSSTSTIAFPSSNTSTNITVKQPTVQSTSPYLQGEVELERRRVTKDGRVKLKLSLLGSTVDRCGICFAQFKSGETGAKGRGCRDGHAFHGACLGRWCAATAREPRCPICREVLVGYQ